MKSIWTVAKKELLDLFRDRKTVALGLLVGPIVMPALILGIGMLAEKKMRTQLESTLELPVVGAEHAPNLVAFLKGRNIEAKDPPPDPDQAVRDQDYDVVLKIDPEYGEQWRASRAARVELIYDSSRQDSQVPVNRLRGVLLEYSRTVGVLRGINRGVSPEAGFAVQIGQRDVATPEARRGMLLAFLPYLLILFSFLGGAALVIDVTAGERERQSLEPLLATPAARSAIMSGKILAATLFGMLSLLLIVLAFKLAFQLAPGPLQLVDVSLPVMAKLLLVLLPMVLIGTTLLTFIAASVKSVKEAQSYMSVLMFLPLVPTIMLMVNPVKDELWQFAVPFLAQNQMILKLIRSEAIAAQEWGVYLAAGFGLGLVLWMLAARLYHQEKLAISA
ncbi:ABC transporter permease [Luteimonas sp. M1R5S18]|uniref:ABC transporter permease n=1 Tax=Luteimonas rhizosphaericola TaxID=3042024 RepID=A0ABT6JL04_9GAMM|nr:ABC transporter permease [Luteimonas rhizosphaericola]MDH5830746.1 ABC transporter permease [Luteimonas rhizosphaericola]